MRADILLFSGQIQKPGLGQKIGHTSQDDQTGPLTGESDPGVHGASDFHSMLEKMNQTQNPVQPQSPVSESEKKPEMLEFTAALKSGDLKNMIIGMLNKNHDLNLTPGDHLDEQEILRQLLEKYGKDIFQADVSTETADDESSKEINQIGFGWQNLNIDGQYSRLSRLVNQQLTGTASENILNQSDINKGQAKMVELGLEALKQTVPNNSETENPVKPSLFKNQISDNGQEPGTKEQLFESGMTQKKDTIGIHSNSSEGNKMGQNIVKESVDLGKEANHLKAGLDNNSGNEKMKMVAQTAQTTQPWIGNAGQDELMIQNAKEQEKAGNIFKESLNPNQPSASETEPASKDANFSLSNHSTIEKEGDIKAITKQAEPAHKVSQKETLGQIVEKATINLKNGHSEARIDLKPEFLGQVRMQIATENNQVSVKIIAELPIVKEIIENNINQLKADLQNQGLNVDKVDVFVANDSRQNHHRHKDSNMEASNDGDRDVEDIDDSETGINESQINAAAGMVNEGIDYFV